ncbi:hypothetical protein GLE_0506 [Lysobacter enzymogenes]|uniref:Uncharacterized protein n=1 Tax=Lysobacter enzymogenes TaxID=69 RepID=A0A0S2DC08_LYSEN|nr:hypothetical protein GLE_0506 [Lysobacter enzymogenes]
MPPDRGTARGRADARPRRMGEVMHEAGAQAHWTLRLFKAARSRAGIRSQFSGALCHAR